MRFGCVLLKMLFHISAYEIKFLLKLKRHEVDMSKLILIITNLHWTVVILKCKLWSVPSLVANSRWLFLISLFPSLLSLLLLLSLFSLFLHLSVSMSLFLFSQYVSYLVSCLCLFLVYASLFFSLCLSDSSVCLCPSEGDGPIYIAV